MVGTAAANGGGGSRERPFGSGTVRFTASLLVGLLGIAVSLLLWPETPGSGNPDPSGLLAFRPELYHGEGTTRHFFEGWYHKLVRTRTPCPGGNGPSESKNENESGENNISLAVVPGVFYDHGGGNGKNESHAFVFLVVNGEKQHYYRFDLDTEFGFLAPGATGGASGSDIDTPYVRIGNNTFSNHGVSLDLVPRDGDDASVSLRGSVRYGPLAPWPIPSARNLGAMGPVGHFLAPFLECHHDVLSFDHSLEGRLEVSSQDETQGGGGSTYAEDFYDSECGSGRETGVAVRSRGYVEKDRGRSFPSLWIWMQTNSFPLHPGTSVFFSVARIPILLPAFLRSLLPGLAEPEFPGFTAAVWLGGSGETEPRGLVPFATWTGAYFEDLSVEDDRVVAVLDSGGIGGGLAEALWPSESAADAGDLLVRLGRYSRAWIGSFFVGYDSRALRYRLELEVDRRVPHALLYAPTARRMEQAVREALAARINVRLYEYRTGAGEDALPRLLLDDTGEHAGLEVHRNVRYLVDNLCGRPTARSRLACL